MSKRIVPPRPPSRYKERDGNLYEVMALPQIGSTRPADVGKRYALIQTLWDAREAEDDTGEIAKAMAQLSRDAMQEADDEDDDPVETDRQIMSGFPPLRLWDQIYGDDSEADDEDTGNLAGLHPDSGDGSLSGD